MKYRRVQPTDLAILDLDTQLVQRRMNHDIVVAAVSSAGLLLVTHLFAGSLAVLPVVIVGCLVGVRIADRTSAFIRREAERARKQVELASAVFLDLVNVMLAGGSGIETAVVASASAGDGPGFSQIRIAVMRAQSARVSYWDSLGELGAQIGVNSLIEVAHTIQLAGESGARIRGSLEARSAALRKRNLARIEHESEQQTEKMGLPLVVLFLGFLVLVGYPAFNQTMNSL